MSLGDHIDYIVEKASSKLSILRKLKFDLDRETLKSMYFSFIRPILEYGDIIFDNCPEFCKSKLEQINLEAARIVTGATKLVSHSLLYRESGLEKLETRRVKHKLVQFYKIKNLYSPEYLLDLLPHQLQNIHRYHTRNSSSYIIPQCKTAYYRNSFIPSVTDLWNNLPNEIKQSPSLNFFKNNISRYLDPEKPPNYYKSGTRKGQILHARLRMACSSLKHHLYLKNIEENPYCTCGRIETTEHFLLHCTNFINQNNELVHSLNVPLTAKLLLYGDKEKNFDFNRDLFMKVQNFIIKTKRF